jgi:hypothetical protein
MLRDMVHRPPYPQSRMRLSKPTTTSPDSHHTPHISYAPSPSTPNTMATPTLDQFLSEINRITLSKDSAQLSQYLVIEPPYAPSYTTIINELRSSYPKGSDSDTALEKKIVKAVKVIDGGDDVEVASWSAFSRFMVLYFGFLRDVDVRNLLETFGLLSEVLQ